jgi:endonuclease YncB( thermonuclease family)
MRRLLLSLPLVAVVQAASAETIEGRIVAVADGDSLTVVVNKDKKRYRVRLAEIDAPELKQPFGAASRKSLAEICLKKPAAIEVIETDVHKRVIARVKCEGIDANLEQVRRGMAWVRAGKILPNSPLYELETNARLRAIGLWAGDKPEPPWVWRERQVATKK